VNTEEKDYCVSKFESGKVLYICYCSPELRKLMGEGHVFNSVKIEIIA